jgi:glutamine cyclotransferase
VGGLNDLEWSGGRVWANILTWPYLAGIAPGSGEVTDIVDARLGGEHHWGDPQAVLNGIAATGGAGEFLLTGKGWRFLHHVRLVGGRHRRRPARLLVPAD